MEMKEILDEFQGKVLEKFRECRKVNAPYNTCVPISGYKLNGLMAEAKREVLDNYLKERE